MGEIIAIASQKGGVGKTTTCVNLGASFAILQKKTLIVDMDPQGSIGASFQFRDQKIKNGIFQVFSKNIPVSDAIYDIGLENLDVVISNVSNEEEEIEFFRLGLNYRILKNVLKPLKSFYDFILVDCPPSLGTYTVNAIVAADSIVIPVQCEYYSIKALGKFFRTVENISNKHNPDLNLLGVLLTMFDKRIKKSKEIENELRRGFKNLVFKTIIPKNSKLASAPSMGKPAALFDISSPGALSYLYLSEEIISKNNKIK